MAIYQIHDKNHDVYLNTHVENTVFIYGLQDLVTEQQPHTTGTALQTVYDDGHTLGLVMQYANHFDIHNFAHDLNGMVQMMVPNGTPLPEIESDGHGGSWIGHAHFFNDPPSVLKTQHVVIMHPTGGAP